MSIASSSSALLKIIDTAYVNNRTKVDILVVEGSSDKETYFPIFLIKQNPPSRFETFQKRNIVFDYHFEDSELAKMEDNGYLITNNKTKKINPNPGNKVRFVVNTIEEFVKNNKEYENINCYGFIDYDFGQHCFNYNLPISETSMHDLETNLLRCYLKEYFHSKIDKETLFKIVVRTLDFSFKQGLLQDTSFDFDETYNLRLIDIVATYFNEETKKQNFTLTSFDPIKYFDSKVRQFNDKTAFPKEYGIICDFKEALTEKIQELYSFNMQGLIKRWFYGTMSSDDCDNLNTIFKYANGHIIIQQLLINGTAYLEINEDLYKGKNDEETSKLLEAAFLRQLIKVIDSNNVGRLFDIKPLISYRLYKF